MNDYDIYLRHAAIHDGDWVGFLFVTDPTTGDLDYIHTRPWLLDPDNPNDPTLGSWGVRRWQINIIAADKLVGLQGVPPTPERSTADIRSDLKAFQDLPAFEFQDLDGTTYIAKMAGYKERSLIPYDVKEPNGAWTMQVTLVETTV